MITDCAYCGILELNDVSFFTDVAELSVLVGPGVIVFTLWRMLVTNKKQMLVLGLESVSFNSTTPQEVPVYLRAVYLMTSVITFALGILVAELVKL